MPAASDIRWTLDRAPWLPARPVTEITLEALPIVADDLTAELITTLAMTVADLQEEMNAVRAVNSAAFTHAHEQQREIVRLRQRVAAPLQQRRAEKGQQHECAS